MGIMERKLKKQAKNLLVFSWVMLVLIIIGEIVISVLLINKMLFAEDAGTAEIIIVVIDIVGFLVSDILVIVKQIIPLGKDVTYYKDRSIERIRALVVNIKSAREFSYDITVKNLENGEEKDFSIGRKDVEMDKVYDFWYLRHSKILDYKIVSTEELTEERREKASKIDFNSKE